MTPNDKVLGFIRTYIPYGISALLAWLLLNTGLDLTGEVQVALVTLTVALVTNAYYLLIRLVESRWPWVGVFLGWPKAPEYQAVDNLWGSLVRTLTPVLASFVVVTAAFYVAAWFGYQLSADMQAGAVVVVMGLFEALYYSAARFITTRWPWWSWLLGTPKEAAITGPVVPLYTRS